MSIEVYVGSRGTVFVSAWSAGWVLLFLDLLFMCQLTTLRKCAGEQAISVVVVIKTMVANVVFKFALEGYLDF